MAVPQSKQALLEAIRSNYQKLMQDLAHVSAARVHDAVMPGHVQGTVMGVADLIAYLIGWNLLVLKWCEASQRGEQVDFPETGFKWNELGRLAQKFYADHAAQDYPSLLGQFEQVHARILALVEGESDAALYGAPWYGKYTLGRMIQFNTSSPYANARARLRKCLRAGGLGEAGEAARI